MYKLISTSPGWVRILWRKDMRPADDVQQAMSQACEVPGIRRLDGMLELPCTTWVLPIVRRVAELCNVALPSNTRVPTAPIATEGLFPHQVFGVDWLQSRLNGGLLADDMGLGKTRQAIVAAEAIRRHYKGACLITGPLFVRDVWRRELLAAGAIDDESQLCVLRSRDLADESFRLGCRYYFLHYDIGDTWWTKLYGRVKPVCAILDEAHWVRNGRAKRSKAAALLIGPAKHRILLTGTPLENRPSDLWHLLTLTTGTSTWGAPLDFRKRYCGAVWTGYGHEDRELTNVAELHARLKPFFLRRTAAEAALQMPALTRTVEAVDVEQSVIDESRRLLPLSEVPELVQAISRGSVAGVLPLLTRLLQTTSAAKLQQTAGLVQNAVEQNESVVVFVHERATAAALAKLLYGAVTVITGELDQAERDQRVQAFQEAVVPVVLIATYGALKEGVTLHRARFVVLHDLTWTLTTLLQAEARVHRIGQKRPCQSIWMVAKGTADALLAPVLQRKAEAMSDAVQIGGGVKALSELRLLDQAGVESVDQQVETALKAWRQT